jgi:hypothetical protein
VCAASWRRSGGWGGSWLRRSSGEASGSPACLEPILSVYHKDYINNVDFILGRLHIPKIYVCIIGIVHDLSFLLLVTLLVDDREPGSLIGHS